MEWDVGNLSYIILFWAWNDAGQRLKNAYEFFNLRALQIPPPNRIHIFQFMAKIFGKDFQSISYHYLVRIFKVYLTIILKCMIFIKMYVFLTRPAVNITVNKIDI